MRLNWFSPLPPAESDVARYTAHLLPALAARSQITLRTDAETWDASLEQHAAVRRFHGRLKSTELTGALNVFHIANQRAHHLAIFRLAHQIPGLIVLHDLAIPNLVGSLPFSARRAQPIAPTDFDRALGIFVHARRAIEIFPDDKAGYHPFPYAARDWPNESTDQSPCRLILFGHLHVNQRLDFALTALAAYPRRDRFHLDVFGRTTKPRRLERTLRQLGLANQVTIHGFVPEPELDAALSRADLALHLRRPTMGEASASQLRIWDHALPSIVTRGGWYGELPEGTVAYADVEHEQLQLHQHLDRLLDEPSFYQQIGVRGRAELLAHHQPESYADALLQLAQKISV